MPNQDVDLIWDGNSLFARSWHAADYPSELSLIKDSEGKSVGYAIAGLKTILSLINPGSSHIQDIPTRMLFCWDGIAKKNKNRAPKPVGYHEGMQFFQSVIQNIFGSQHAFPEQDEADDAVATAALLSEKEGNTVYVCSGDKDLQQVQGGKIHYYSLNTKSVVSREDILKKWNVKRPSQISIALAILGDRVDSIPGVPKMGPKAVSKLFENVSKSDNFSRALSIVRNSLTPDQKVYFDTSFECTVLRDVSNLPVPKTINMSNPADLSQFGLDRITGEYTSVYCARNGIQIEDMFNLD